MDKEIDERIDGHELDQTAVQSSAPGRLPGDGAGPHRGLQQLRQQGEVQDLPEQPAMQVPLRRHGAGDGHLAVHRSREVRERMHELSFPHTFTPAYSPQYNGVEEVINIGKQMVKKERLECLLNGKDENLNEMILKCFNNINVL